MTYLALLRGINVWWNKKVEIPRLKSCFENLDYANVQTYINTGNVIFDSEDDDFSKIEGILEETFGFEIRTVFRSAENIRNLAEQIPKDWKNDDEQKTDILFLWDEYNNEESLNLIKIHPEVDHILYLPWAIVWNISREHYSKSGMNTFIKSKLYKHMTARNINTMRKLWELMNS